MTSQGLFTHDNDVQLFDLAVAMVGPVDIRSYGYAGGTTSIGFLAPSGGFDTRQRGCLSHSQHHLRGGRQIARFVPP
jgi:hypothetical protein